MKLARLLIGLFTITALAGNSLVAFADDSNLEGQNLDADSIFEEISNAQDLTSSDTESDEVDDSKLQETSNKLQENLDFLRRLEDNYGSSMSEFNQINQTLKDTQVKLRDVHSESITLKEELFYLDKVIDISQKKVIAINRQVTEKTNMLSILEAQLRDSDDLIEQQRQFVADYVKFLYQQEHDYFGNSGDGELQAVGFLLAEQSLGNLENEQEYMLRMNELASQVMDELSNSEKSMNTMHMQIESEKEEIAGLEKILASEQSQLSLQKAAKSNLLEQTQGEEDIYKELLEKAKAEKEEARTELYTLKNNLDLVRKKVKLLGEDFDPAAFEDLLDKSSQQVYEFYLSAANNENVSRMAWPVLPNPNRGISAYFKDAEYKNWAGIAHNAIDIPTPQNTTIRSPLNCVVYKTKDNGFGYSYVILACKGGYMLTFGHVTGFLVNEGDRVAQGQPVALSGGAPGSKGAGSLTTGSHLHFEVMKDGKYRDPLDFLDLTLLPYDTLPEQYKARIDNTVRSKSLQ